MSVNGVYINFIRVTVVNVVVIHIDGGGETLFTFDKVVVFPNFLLSTVES